MKLDVRFNLPFPVSTVHRRGSTLVIVVALLGLLAFMGMVFYSFAAQERAASENFSDAAKFAVDEPSNVFDHMLRQVIVGPANTPSERASILASSTNRHSLVRNLVGYDIHPHTGDPIEVEVNANGIPFVPRPRLAVDSDGDGVGDIIDRDNDGNPDPADWLEFVDSPSARVHVGYRERGLEGNQPPFVAPPAPDVDYTYPDINNLFLAYRGTAIRDNRDTNGNTPPGKSTFEEVKVIIPSFFRPQYMKSVANNGPGGSSVPTDVNWIAAWDGQNANRGNVPYPARGFRPHPRHIAGRLENGSIVFRYVADDEAGALGLKGGFPFHPEQDANNVNNNPTQLGEMGLWTGSHPDVYELDVDNDGDGINEGIWMDLAYPIQETSDGTEYAVLHSVTIYDLDSLLDLNVHGNLAGLSRLANLSAPAPLTVRDGRMHNQFISRSNLGLGPYEVNPLWALRRVGPIDPQNAQRFQYHFGRIPSTDVEQANMEWIWLLAGRLVHDETPINVLGGRWGELERVFNTYKQGGTRNFADLPRPGRSGQANVSGSSGIRFGGSLNTAGRNGFDDNQDRMEGETLASEKRFRPFGHPNDYSGAGRTTLGLHADYNTSTLQFDSIQGSPRNAILHRGPNSSPARWLRYQGYSVNRAMDLSVNRYAFGENGTYEEGVGANNDDLVADPFYDALFEDPMETVFDQDFAQRQFDQIFGPQDLVSLQMSEDDLDLAKVKVAVSRRVNDLAPHAFSTQRDEIFLENNEIRERFTTLSNSLRRFALRHDLGADMVMHPNSQNRDGNGNIIDDDGPRAWEFTANVDNDAYPEFPPAFGNDPANGKPYTPTDPFRPQVRRMLTVEAGEQRELAGQLPLSVNHLLDVERTNETPDPTTQPAQFLRYMRRAGLRFRTLTEHPSARAEGDDVLDLTSVPNYDPAARIPFPPQTVADREFWARRDRQQLARDVYVLLYTIGGAQRDAANAMKIADYRRPNDPLATPGTPTALYSHQQLREMAQFAVNLVDAMDPDDVITKFEYDKNLGADLNDPTRGGWNLDDDPYTIDPNETPLPETDNDFGVVTDRGRHREDGFTRGVVYGVESQQLAISEVLAVGLDPQPGAMDHASTLYDDSAGRRHLFIELQNMQPLPADLATEKAIDMNSATWRIVRYDRTDLNDPLGGVGNANRPFRALAFLGNSPVSQQVVPGQRYTIASAADNTIVSSDLFVDYDMDGTYDVIAPNVNGAAPPGPNTNPNDANAPELKPRTNLDLIHPDHAGGWYMVDENGTQIGTAGAFIDQLKDYAGNDPQVDLHGGDFRALGRSGFDLVLQRRANTNLPSLNHGLVPGEDPNPWVDVDVFRVQFLDLAFQMTDQAPEVQNHLNNLTSDERREPLDDATRARFGGNPADFRFNTLTAGNNSTGSGFNLWQAHFDRDFANLGELLSVPLVGPGKLTSTIGRINSSPTLQALPPRATAFEPEALVAAAAKFLRPDFPNDTNQSDLVNRARDNRWYRLFQFLEVPSRVHRMLGNYVSLSRVPGKVNLNTIRHWEVYAGLVDNPTVMDRMPKPDVPNGINVAGRITLDRTRDENSNFPSSPRDRWIEYLRERDGDYVNGYDPQAGQPRRMLVPGMPRSNPFHSPGYRGPSYEATRKDDAFETTMFRTLTPDRVDTGGNSAETNRNWLELGNANQHMTPDGTALMHQHQILAKMLGNTTTVSNTFVVFASAAYFEAVEHKVNNVGTGLYRIGSRIDIDTADGKSKTNPGWQQRSVFIIDRTDAFKAFDPGSGDFDWQRLVKARLEIE